LGLQINIPFVDENTLDPRAADSEPAGHNFPTIPVPIGARAPYKMDRAIPSLDLSPPLLASSINVIGKLVLVNI
jgi:hypothetical protein